MPADKLREHFERRIAEGLFPSAAWCVSKGGVVRSEGAAGYAVVEPESVPAEIGTIYDLASLTKPLVTALLASIFFERGAFGPDSPVSRFLPGFDREDKRGITVEDLLAHRSGFEAWRPLYLEVGGTGRKERLAAAVDLIASLPLEAAPRTKVIYSDLNYILLSVILEQIGGDDLSSMFREFVAAPLGLEDTVFDPGEYLRGRCAASERGNKYEKELSATMGFYTSNHGWREEVIRGEVHDGNCLFFGGISGHAGLFSTASGTVTLAAQFLPGSRLLSGESLDRFRANLTPGLEQARSAGFQLAATESSSAHGVLPDSAFGHLGFTGTTLWIDPDSTAIYVALTNRTHAGVPFADLSRARMEFLEISLSI